MARSGERSSAGLKGPGDGWWTATSPNTRVRSGRVSSCSADHALLLLLLPQHLDDIFMLGLVSSWVSVSSLRRAEPRLASRYRETRMKLTSVHPCPKTSMRQLGRPLTVASKRSISGFQKAQRMQHPARHWSKRPECHGMRH